MKPKQIEIYDTTLRDGSQGEGINFSLSDKLRIAERLDQFGVHYIEGGWPGSNPKDLEFFKQAARRKWKNARIASFGFTRRKGVAVENDEQIRMLLDAETPVITIVGKTWLLHVTEVQSGTKERFYLLGAWDGDPDKNILSYLTPFAKIFVGQPVGAEVAFRSEGQSKKYRIESIAAYVVAA